MPSDNHESQALSDQRVVTLMDIVEFVRSSWWRLLMAAVGTAVLAGATGFLMRPTYRATVVVTPASADEMRSAISRMAGGLGGLASLAGVSLPQGSKDKEEALAILKSRLFAEAMIREQGMMPLFFPRRWDAKAGTWRAGDPDDRPTMQDAVEVFDKRIINVVEDRDRGLISVSVEWNDRELAAKWANLMIARVNEQLRARRLVELDKSVTYLNREIDRTNVVELRASLFKLVEAQINERMVANVRDEFAFRVIDPAVVPDRDRYVRPRKALMAAIGFMSGLLACGAWLAARQYARRYRSREGR